MEYRQLNIYDWMQEDSFIESDEFQNTVDKIFVNQTKKQKKNFEEELKSKAKMESIFFNEDLRFAEEQKIFGNKGKKVLKDLEDEAINLEKKRIPSDQFRMHFDANNNIRGIYTTGTDSVHVNIDDMFKKSDILDVAGTISKYKVPLAIGTAVLAGGLLLGNRNKKDNK